MKIKERCKSIYTDHIKGNIKNIILVVCISGFVFGFFMGYLMTESEKMEMAQIEEVASEKLKSTKNIENESKKNDIDIVKIAEEVSPSVVVVKNKIYIGKGDNKILKDRGMGSGIIYTDDGYVITNQHVVRKASIVTVVLEDGSEHECKVIGEDPRSDLAVIKIEGENLHHGKFGDSSRLKVGESVVAIGSPLGEEFSGTVTSGIVSSTERNLDLGNRNAKLIQTDTAINPGNSGGALVNSKGEIIGINSLKISSSQVEGMAFAIPIDTARPIVNELIENGFIKRPWLGLGLANSRKPEGIYVGGIMKDGPGDNGKLHKGDIIIEIDGIRVENISQLSKKVETYSPNALVELTILRDNKDIKVSITLGETSKSSPF